MNDSDKLPFLSSEALSTLIELSPIGAGISMDGFVVTVNKVFLKMYGYGNVGEIRGISVMNLIAPQSRKFVSELIKKRALGLDTEKQYETIGLRTDGTEFPLLITSKRLETSDGPLTLAYFIDLTEQHQNESRVRDFFKSNSSVMLLVSPNTCLIADANLAAIKFYGYDRSKLIGMNINTISMLSPQQVAEEKIVANEEGRNYILSRHRLASGEERDVELNFSPVHHEGQPMMFHIVNDITRRKQAELFAAKQLKRNQILMDTAIEGIHILDENGRLVEANESFCRMLGYTQEEVSGLCVFDWDVDPRLTPDEFAHRFKIVMDKPSMILTQNRRKDGRVIDIELNAAGVTLDGKNYVYVASRDITKRLRAENALRENERFTRTITDNIPGMLGYWTSERRCEFANKGYLEWFGRTSEQMKGISMQELLGEVIYPLNKPYIDGVLCGENQVFERTVTKPNGEVGHLVVQYIAHILNRVVVGFFVLVTDITRLKLVEEQLQAAASSAIDQEKVIGQLKEHTSEIKTALKMLIQHRQEIMNEEKIALSEELEQLIMPFLSRLKKDAREAKQKSLLKIIESNLQQLISSYGRVTTFAQVSKKLTPKEVEIASLIRQGLSSKEIAAILSLSPETVSNHRKSIRNKLGLDSRVTNLRSALISLFE